MLLRAMGFLILLLPVAFGNALAAGSLADGVRLSVRNAPVPVRVNGNREVFYELHIENQGERPIKLVQVSLRENPGDDKIRASYDGAELLGNLQIFDGDYRAAGRDYLRDEKEDPNSIGSSMVGVVFLQFVLDEDETLPDSWLHDVIVQRTSADGQRIETPVSGGVFTLSQREPLTIRPPLQGGPWWVFESMENAAVHRRAMVLQSPLISQRYGVDYMKLGESGSTFGGDDPTRQEAWYGYGEPVFAVADGVVTDLIDGVPENTPLSPERAVPMTIDTINGNYVILDIGSGYYAVYGHMIPNSIRPSLGQRVSRGDVIGLLGNSGNSEGPHLHFHLGTENMVFEAEGLPYAYEQFKVLGRVDMEQIQVSGFSEEQKMETLQRRDEIPGNFTVVEFPETAGSVD